MAVVDVQAGHMKGQAAPDLLHAVEDLPLSFGHDRNHLNPTGAEVGGCNGVNPLARRVAARMRDQVNLEMAWAVKWAQVGERDWNHAFEAARNPQQPWVPDRGRSHGPEATSQCGDADFAQQLAAGGIQPQLTVALEQAGEIYKKGLESLGANVSRRLPDQRERVAKRMAFIAPGPRSAHRWLDSAAAAQH